MDKEDYAFPEDEFFGVCTVSSFRDGKMYVSTENQKVGVNIPAGENWDSHFKKGDTLEVYIAPDNFTHYKKYSPEVNDD
jgi:hypothetical protein